MNNLAIAFTIVNATALLTIPRKYAFLPLIIGACYMTRAQGFDIGSASFNVVRMLIFIGFIRIILRNERPIGLGNIIDKMVLFWAAAAISSSIFHQEISSALVYRLGLVYDICGIYFLCRIFCQSYDELIFLIRATVVLLLPIATAMLIEQIKTFNMFSYFGGVSQIPPIREGRIRAQGPFSHPILAGTVGAICLPLSICIWNKHKKTSLLGNIVCITIIYCSSSSGPVLSTMAAIGALLLWKFRKKMKFFKWIGVISYILLDLMMNRPAYYIMSSIDVAGGSTGWHRARLIQSAFEHINEWWAGGTDYTRHWMPTGVSWSPNHTDITNYYIKMGVIGGLPLMIALIAIFWFSYKSLGKLIEYEIDDTSVSKFTFWALGSSLFAIVTTSVSVNFFDQSFLFVYLIIALISSGLSAIVHKQL